MPANSSHVANGFSVTPPPSTYTGRTAKDDNCDATTPVATPSSRGHHVAIEPTSVALQPGRSPLLGTNSEDFGCSIIETDGDYAELINRVKKLEGPRKPSSPREGRLNVRDVEENEDYGGAFFTVEEKKLLGISCSKETCSLPADLFQIPSGPRKRAHGALSEHPFPRLSLTALLSLVSPMPALTGPAFALARHSTPAVKRYAPIKKWSWKFTLA